MGPSTPFIISIFIAGFCSNIGDGFSLGSQVGVTHSHFLSFLENGQGAVAGLKADPDEKLEKQYDTSGMSKLPEEIKYPMIYGVHKRLESVFGKINEHWYQDWKLWVGGFFWFSIWAKWLIFGFDEIYYVRALFAFGINIVILHQLQYASTIKAGMFQVCILLTAQALLQSFLDFKAQWEKEERLETEFKCDTLYLDLSLPALQIGVLFGSQCCVWWFYMTSILGNFDFALVNYAFWAVAFLAMQMTMIFNRGADSALGNPFPNHEIYDLWLNCERFTLQLEGSAEKEFRISPPNILLRAVMGYFCNVILREIMAYTIPLMLMGFSEPMDFVVYCVGVNFICTLDDMQDRIFQINLVDGSDTGSVEAKEPKDDPDAAAKATPPAIKEAA